MNEKKEKSERGCGVRSDRNYTRITVCMVSLLSLNGHMSSHFDIIHLKLPKHAYFALLFHSMLSEYENSKNKFL